jgi:hypothetical protein
MALASAEAIFYAVFIHWASDRHRFFIRAHNNLA